MNESELRELKNLLIRFKETYNLEARIKHICIRDILNLINEEIEEGIK